MADGDDIEQKIKLTYVTNADKTAKKVKKLDDSIEKTTKSQKESGKQTKKNKQGLDDLGGGIGATIKGFKGLIKQMWLMVANPIGLIIAAIAIALTTLFKAFTSTKAGAEKFDQIMAGISATIDVVRDRVLKIASAIAKFFSGDFAGALADGRAAVSGFGDEVAEEFRKAANATESLQRVADAMRDLGVSRARLNRDLKEAKEIIESETASYDDKKRAIDEVGIAEQEQTEKELANAQKKLDAIRTLNALSDSSSEALQEEADAEIALFNIQEKSADNKTKNILLLRKADNEERARIKELTAARATAAKEREKIASDEAAAIEAINKKQRDTEDAIRKAIENTEDDTEEERLARRKEREIERLDALEQEGVDVREALILNDQLFNELEDELREKRVEEKIAKDEKEKADQAIRDKEAADDRQKIEEIELAHKEKIEAAKINLAKKIIGFAVSLFGKSKKAKKAALIIENAVGLAEVGIDTAKGITKATAKGPAGIPEAILIGATGAISAATIISATAKGLKELGGGSAGSGTRIRTAGGASAAPQVGFQASSENQIATTFADNINEQPPIEAFVVESKITTAQALARNRVEDNSFG